MVTEDGHGRRFGTYVNRLVRLNGNRGTDFWESPSYHTLEVPFPDPAYPNALWVGAGPGQVVRVDTETLLATDSIRIPLAVSGTSWTMDVHRTPDGRLWIACRGGLVVVENGTARPVEALAGVPVRDLITGPDGSLWAATETLGLVRLRNGALDVVGLEAGLPTTYLLSIIFDDLGFAWMNGRSLLYRVRTADLERAFDATTPVSIDVITLRPSDGHLGSSHFFSRPARAPDGSLWIPSSQGVTRIDPAAYAEQFERPPHVLVEAIQTDSEEQVPTSDMSSIRLPRGERSLSMVYTALDFTAPALLRFRTQLVGLDATWRDQGTARSAVYGGLAPGRYTFRVQARNGGGVWSDPVEASLVVPAYFYETGWFAFLCILGLLAALGGGLHLREQTQQRRRQHLEAVVDERTRQLQSEKETVASQARRLQTLDTAKSAFFSNVSHEFRTPLTLILGPLDDLKSGLYGALPTPMAPQVHLARRNARRMLDLVNQILDVARLEAGRTQLQVRPFELCAFVVGIADLFQALATRKSIDLDVDRPLHSVEVVADPMQLEKVVVNLLSNALKFTPTGGAVRVTITARHGIARVSVQDSGPGIPADDIPHIFDRFYRVGGAMQMHPGTGIGLALAKEIMDLHEGTLTVESERGAGSTFTLTLPRRAAHIAPRQPAQPAASWTPDTTHTFVDLTPDHSGHGPALDETDPDSDRTTILVVEDHPEVRAYIRRHLEQASGPYAPYRILEAADGEAGLALAKARLPDIVLSDVMMPTLDGMELCRALKSDPETGFIPVILLTAKAAPEDKIEGLGELADAYLTKPFDVAELQAHITNLIAVRTRLRERFQQEGMALHAGKDTDPSTRLPELEAVASTTDVFLGRVRETVALHLSDDTFSVQRLADEVGVSRGHLHRQLKALAGLTPTDLIRTMRLEQAAHLLACQAGTVSE
ncbi:MAG: ATP-binding protein, partial [Longimonas sp.]|uniref:ATP-binding protein n=1 Tax=Longimonas sp. TaxID=2039626 RepID=UPI003975FF67